MFSLKRLATALAALTIVFSATGTAPGQAQSTAWWDALVLQLANEEGCNITEILSSEEGILGSNVFFEARVQCEDGRQFDVSRIEPDEKFTVRICEIVDMVC